MFQQKAGLWKSRYKVIWKSTAALFYFYLRLPTRCQSDVLGETSRADPPRLPAFLLQPDYFRSFDKWLLSLKRMEREKKGKKTKPIWVVYGSDLSLHRLRALLSFIPARDSLGTTVYFDMRNSSHTHTHTSTQTQMHIPGSVVVISLALAAGMTSWRRRW